MFTLYACSVRHFYSIPNRTSELNPPLKNIQQILDDVSACIIYKMENMKMEDKLQSGIDLIRFHVFLPSNCRCLQSPINKSKKSFNSPALNYVHLLLHWSVGRTQIYYLYPFEKKSNPQIWNQNTTHQYSSLKNKKYMLSKDSKHHMKKYIQ